jgi:hypothetical protein
MGLRSSERNWRKDMSSLRVAGYNPIGILTNPKLIDPFHMALIGFSQTSLQNSIEPNWSYLD